MYGFWHVLGQLLTHFENTRSGGQSESLPLLKRNNLLLLNEIKTKNFSYLYTYLCNRSNNEEERIVVFVEKYKFVQSTQKPTVY